MIIQQLFFLVLIFSVTLVCRAISFIPAPEITLPAAQTTIASGDLNNDGIPDLIIGGEPVGNEQGKVRVLLGTGNGTFGSPTEYRVGFDPASIYHAPHVQTIKVADLDEDGKLDVVVAHNGERDITNRSMTFATILFGLGNGFLLPADGYTFLAQTNSIVVSSIDFGDFNSDGKKDVVLSCKVGSGLGTAYFLENSGNRQFVRKYFPIVGANIYQIASADFDNDSFADLIMTTNEGVFIIYGNGNYYDPTSRTEHRDAGISEIGLVVRDFNSDGRKDFAVVETANKRFRVFLNGQNGLAISPIVYETNVFSNLLESADINNDGKLDLLISDNQSGNYQIFYGTGIGTFGNAETIANNLPVSDIVLDDFDRNGKIDIAFSLWRDPPASQAGILLNSPRRQAVAADFDGDGKSDVSVFRPENGVWYLSQSSAGFSGIAFGLGTDKLVPADYDGDGKTDVAVYRSGTWYLQRSLLGFTGIAFGNSDDIPVPADYDGDGKAEVAVFRPSNGTWYLLRSSLGFTAVQFGISTDKPVAADYDSDGKADIAVFRNGTLYLQRSRL